MEKIISKIKINHFSSGWWYQPSIWTTSKRRWAARPYANLQKLLKNEEILDKNFVLSLNGDKDLKVFRWIANEKNYKTFFNNEQIRMLNKDETIEERIPKCKIIIYWDLKGYKLLNKGVLPYFELSCLKQMFKNGGNIVWRRAGFKINKSP
jgi:hypothetical protein